MWRNSKLWKQIAWLVLFSLLGTNNSLHLTCTKPCELWDTYCLQQSWFIWNWADLETVSSLWATFSTEPWLWEEDSNLPTDRRISKINNAQLLILHPVLLHHSQLLHHQCAAPMPCLCDHGDDLFEGVECHLQNLGNQDLGAKWEAGRICVLGVFFLHVRHGKQIFLGFFQVSITSKEEDFITDASEILDFTNERDGSCGKFLTQPGEPPDFYSDETYFMILIHRPRPWELLDVLKWHSNGLFAIVVTWDISPQ